MISLGQKAAPARAFHDRRAGIRLCSSGAHARQRHEDAIMRLPGVLGLGVGVVETGEIVARAAPCSVQ
jgi:hypothetical protein